MQFVFVDRSRKDRGASPAGVTPKRFELDVNVLGPPVVISSQMLKATLAIQFTDFVAGPLGGGGGGTSRLPFVDVYCERTDIQTNVVLHEVGHVLLNDPFNCEPGGMDPVSDLCDPYANNIMHIPYKTYASTQRFGLVEEMTRRLDLRQIVLIRKQELDGND